MYFIFITMICALELLIFLLFVLMSLMMVLITKSQIDKIVSDKKEEKLQDKIGLNKMKKKELFIETEFEDNDTV